MEEYGPANESLDFYFYNDGPFTVRVYSPYSQVERIAEQYLIDNKNFGIDVGCVQHELFRVSRAASEKIVQATWTKKPAIISAYVEFPIQDNEFESGDKPQVVPIDIRHQGQLFDEHYHFKKGRKVAEYILETVYPLSRE